MSRTAESVNTNAKTSPDFNLVSVRGAKESKDQSYVQHGVSWYFTTKKTEGLNIRLNTLPLGEEVVAYGNDSFEGKLKISSGTSPDYVLFDTSVDGDGGNVYHEIGVGWVFDKSDKEGPFGVSFKLNARPLSGNLVAFEFVAKAKAKT